MSKLLCVIVAKSVKDSQSSESSVQDLVEAMAKRKHFEENLKKINIEGENVWKELNHLLFAKLHVQESMVSKDKPGESVDI